MPSSPAQDYYPFGMTMPGRRYPASPSPNVSGGGTPDVPIELYRHGFKTKAPGTSDTYTATPNAISAYLGSSQWQVAATGYSMVFVSYASVDGTGASMDSALGIASTPNPSTYTFTCNVQSGYRMTLSSFSFFNRSTSSGFTNWAMTVNGISVGSGSLSLTTGALISTGTLIPTNAVSALTGTVTVVITLSGASARSGTFRLDNFVLNGFVQALPGTATIASATGSDRYRYGFNGQERDGEIGDDSYGAEFWEYDSRIGRRWNLDPKPQPNLSRYSGFNNSPIWKSDRFGDTLDLSGIKSQNEHGYNSLVKDFESKTGLKLGVDANGIVDYAKTPDGQPIINIDENGKQVGSKKARETLIKIISPQSAKLSVTSDNTIATKVLSTRNKNGKHFYTNTININTITIEDQMSQTSQDLDKTTCGYALSFFHELGHTLYGGSHDDNEGTDGFSNPSPNERLPNKIRRELGPQYGQQKTYLQLPIYETGKSYLPFSNQSLEDLKNQITPTSKFVIVRNPETINQEKDGN